MRNEYEIRGEVTAIFLKSPKYGDMETLIDTINLDKAKELEWSWHAAREPRGNTFYAIGNTKSGGRKTTIKLHRHLTNCPEHLVVDHMNHDTLDNRNSNLRLITQRQNKQNRKGANSNNTTSGLRGVTWQNKDKKWIANLKVDGVHKHIGSFSDKDLARIAVETARAKYMPYSQEAM